MPKKKQVKRFTQAECRRVQAEMQAAVQKVADQLGIQVEFGRYRFRPTDMSLPLTFTVSGAAAEAIDDAAKNEFEQYAENYGLKPEHFGQEFDLYDGVFKIVGCKPRASKNTIIVEKVKTRTGQRAKPGQKFVCPHQEILRALGDTVSVGQYDEID